MPHTITRQHRTFHKGTWRPTSSTTTVANPVGKKPTPTCRRHSTRGGKRERNLHAEGRSSPSKPSAGGRASGRRSRRVRNRRTGRHTGNYRTITRNLCATPPAKGKHHPNPPFPNPPPPKFPPWQQQQQMRTKRCRTF